MKDNKLIAEFMGANPFHYRRKSEDALSYEMYGVLECIDDGVNSQHFFVPDDMRFHESWDWLMPVIAVCRQESNPEDSHWEKIYYSLEETDINVTHSAVVEFIKNYKTI